MAGHHSSVDLQLCMESSFTEPVGDGANLLPGPRKIMGGKGGRGAVPGKLSNIPPPCPMARLVKLIHMAGGCSLGSVIVDEQLGC